MKNIIINFLPIALWLFILGCTSESKDWENAKKENSIISYENFLKSYPEGVFADSANILLEKLHINQISGTLIGSNNSPEAGQTVYILFVNNDTVSLKFEKNKPINPNTISDANGKILIEFKSSTYKDINEYTIGINSYGPQIIKSDNTPIIFTMEKIGKEIKLGNITLPRSKIHINEEIIWNVDSTGSYTIEKMKIKGANRITINKDLSINLDKGTVSNVFNLGEVATGQK